MSDTAHDRRGLLQAFALFMAGRALPTVPTEPSLWDDRYSDPLEDFKRVIVDIETEVGVRPTPLLFMFENDRKELLMRCKLDVATDDGRVALHQATGYLFAYIPDSYLYG